MEGNTGAGPGSGVTRREEGGAVPVVGGMEGELVALEQEARRLRDLVFQIRGARERLEALLRRVR